MSELIGVVAHDAGGANLIRSWIEHEKPNFLYHVGGPAQKAFLSFAKQNKFPTLDYVIQACDWILTGSSWNSTLELQAISRARALNKRSVTFLDHWTHYESRFCRGTNIILPDALWVADSHACKLARAAFPEVPICLKENYYVNQIVKEISEFRTVNGFATAPDEIENEILYICEPIADHMSVLHGDPLALGFTEFDALNYFLSHMPRLFPNASRLTLRLHPSEKASKYDLVFRSFPVDYIVARDTSLSFDIARSQAVVGVASMALYTAAEGGARVFSSIPPGCGRHDLPSTQIMYLRDL